jgi:type II secretory pathway component PulF
MVKKLLNWLVEAIALAITAFAVVAVVVAFAGPIIQMVGGFFPSV